MNGMYEELIDKLRKNNRMSGWTHIDRLMDDAIKAIEALQQENEQLKADIRGKDNEINDLKAIIEYLRKFEPRRYEAAREGSV